MNAVEVIEKVRARGADLAVDGAKLVIRGRGERLPGDLKALVKEYKPAIIVALGGAGDFAVESVLDELRPYLSANLRELPNAKLSVLVNFAIMHAWGAMFRNLKPSGRLDGAER